MKQVEEKGVKIYTNRNETLIKLKRINYLHKKTDDMRDPTKCAG